VSATHEFRLSRIALVDSDRYEVTFGDESDPFFVATCTVEEGEVRTLTSVPDLLAPEKIGHAWTGDAASLRAVFAAVMAFHDARVAGWTTTQTPS